MIRRLLNWWLYSDCPFGHIVAPVIELEQRQRQRDAERNKNVDMDKTMRLLLDLAEIADRAGHEDLARILFDAYETAKDALSDEEE